MPHRSVDAPSMLQKHAAEGSAARPLLAVVVAGCMLFLSACGSDPVNAGATGGVVNQADASVAQRNAMEHCRKYGKNGRVTGPLSRDTFSFICE
jgi:hypothetical protein